MAAQTAAAQAPLRLLIWHSELGRNGPGLLLRDLGRDDDGIDAAVSFLVGLAPDVVVVLDIDHDWDGLTAQALQGRLQRAGLDLPHLLVPQPNSGTPSGFDLDRDGRLAEPEDALGYGAFPGSGGIVVLSRWPLRLIADHTGVLWRDAAPDRLPVTPQGRPYFTPDELALLPLAAVGAFEVGVSPTDHEDLTLMIWHASPPAFDGPEQRNRLRNAAQSAFWLDRLSAAPGAVVVMANTNMDPDNGDGDPAVMRALLDHPRVQDPAPVARHPGLARVSQATAWWPDGPGALRTSYVLPDAALTVRETGLSWLTDARHAAVWVDLLPLSPP